jgi:hypothetical protein
MEATPVHVRASLQPLGDGSTAGENIPKRMARGKIRNIEYFGPKGWAL